LARKLKGSARKLTALRWLTLRKISQAFFLIAFLVFFFWSKREFYLNPADISGIKHKLINLPLQLDPLVMISQMIASRKILAGSLLALITIILSLLLGRVWCGWFCPVGTLLDWIPLRSWKRKQPNIPEGYRGIKYVLLMVILIAAVFTNLTLLIFDPLTILYRTLTSAIWPGLDQIISSVEVALYQIPFFQTLVGGFDSLIRPAILPASPASYRYGVLYFGFFIFLIALNAFTPRFWCRYVCPLGGFFGLLGKVSLIHCEVSTECSLCGSCFSTCPTGAIQTNQQVFCDPGECTMCMACAAECPGGAITYPAKSSRFLQQPYDVDRRKALWSLGTAVVGATLLESNLLKQPSSQKLIRPPGVDQQSFLSTCIRCGECSTVCPTNAIQMSVVKAGVEGFWTPVLVPRIGYCDYSCNACGQVCPVEAIPPLSLEKKRLQIIGRAFIDRTRCLPWAEGQTCIVCEEMCPVPEKAIRLEDAVQVSPDGDEIILQRPYVIHNLCIGCGICENKCPASGEAAIQIQQYDSKRKGKHQGYGNDR